MLTLLCVIVSGYVCPPPQSSSLCVTVSFSVCLPLSPLTFAPFFPPPHLSQCLSFPSLPLQGQLHCILQMSGLIVYKHWTALVKMHNLSICASWYSWIYLQVPMLYFFFACFYGLYYCHVYILVGISNKNQDITGKYSVMQSAFP